MSGTTVQTTRTTKAGTDVDDVRLQFNAMVDALDLLVNGDALLSAPGLAIGVSSAAAVKFNDLIFQVDGMRFRIAASEVAFTATTHDIADPDAAPREAIYVLSASAGASAPTITKGTTAAANAAVAPATPAGHVKFGEVKVQHDGSAIFDASTDLLSAAHLTDTYTSETPYTAALVSKVVDRNSGV